MIHNILEFATVIDTNDPTMLGRIRVDYDTETNGTILSSIKETYKGRKTKNDDGTLKDEFKWSEIDLFVCHPLISTYFISTPKEKELVNILRPNPEYRFNQPYYIPAPLSSFKNRYNDNAELQRRLVTKDRTIRPANLKKPGTNEYYSVEEKGIAPDPDTIAILGRGNNDILLKDGDILIRTGVSEVSPNDSKKIIPFNNNRGFIQLSSFTAKIDPKEPTTRNLTILSNQYVKTLMEWDILNPENDMDMFSVRISLYRLPENRRYQTETITNSISNRGYFTSEDKFLINTIQLDRKSSEEVINIINEYIQNINQGKINIPGFPIKSISDQFPCFIKPSDRILQYQNQSPSGTLNNTITQTKNVISISNGIKFKKTLDTSDNDNTNENKGIFDGIGFIYSQNNTRQPIEIRKIQQNDINVENIFSTSLLTSAYNTYVLSNQTQIPGKPKIILDQEGGLGISQEDIIKKIYPATEPMVRGEQLMNLLNLIVRYLITHVHPLPGLGPLPITIDGTNVEDILTKMLNANNTILNQNIRIN